MDLQPTTEDDLAEILAAIDDLVDLAVDGHLAEQGLALLAQRCRTALRADVVLVAVRRCGRTTVVPDADPDLDPAELARQVALAGASLDDPVIDGHPGLPGAEGAPVHSHMRRLVTELPRHGTLRMTLTVCRHPPFAGTEVEQAMAFANLAGLVLVQGPASDGAAETGTSGAVDVVARLFAVGLTLHLVLRETADEALRTVVEEAIDQLDRAILDLRRAAFATHAQG